MEPERMTREDDPLSEACKAVAHALRPRLADIIAKQITWPTARPLDDIAFVLKTRIQNQSDKGKTVPYWDAHCAGDNGLIVALMELRRIDKSTASHLIGAALQAQICAGQDLTRAYVLELAEAATVLWVDSLTKPTVDA